MTTRPRLRTTRRLVDRGDGALQLGIGDDALVLSGLPRALADVTRRLDGTVTLHELQSQCARAGLAASALETLLDMLEEAGALDRSGPSAHHRTLPVDQLDSLAARVPDAASARVRLARPGRARVVVAGRGSLAESVTEALRPVVGLVLLVDPEHDLPPADLVVTVGRDVVDPVLAGRALHTGRPVLPVVAGSGGGVVVGPWHGRPDEACPQCLDLRRADADRAWPHLVTELSRPERDGRVPAASVDDVVARLAGAVVAQWVRRRVVGLAENPGLTCEIDPWDLGMVHRVWPVHPRCEQHSAARPAPARRAPALAAS